MCPAGSWNVQRTSSFVQPSGPRVRSRICAMNAAISGWPLFWAGLPQSPATGQGPWSGSPCATRPARRHSTSCQFSRTRRQGLIRTRASLTTPCGSLLGEMPGATACLFTCGGPCEPLCSARMSLTSTTWPIQSCWSTATTCKSLRSNRLSRATRWWPVWRATRAPQSRYACRAPVAQSAAPPCATPVSARSATSKWATTA